MWYTEDGSSTRGWYNPITYRGYYYDSDISLYTLGTRYYDPATGRFISPDAYDAGALSGAIATTGIGALGAGAI